MDMRDFTARFFFSDKIHHRIIRHLVLFVTMNALFMMLAWIRSGDSRTASDIISTVFVNSLFFFGYAYITAFVLFPILLFRKRFVLFFLAFIATGLFISYLKFIFSDYIFYDEIMAKDFSSRMFEFNWSYLITNTKDMTFIVAVFLIAKFAKDNHSIHTKLDELKQAQMEAEYKVISSQLDPHVLFNNLNNLYSISISNREALVPMIQRLKSMLAYYFRDGRSESIPLNREIEVIRDYIALEKIRFGERLEADIKTPSNAGTVEIAPFILFPFVQNCFEHGLSIDAGKSWLNVRIDVNDNHLEFLAQNSKPSSETSFSENGSNTSPERRKKQLDLLYPGRYQLIVENSNREYSVSLKLKL
jgi:sensor histidine kinase YesM